MDIPLRKSYKILVIGESCTDLYRFGRCTRLSAEAPVPILLQQRTESKPGMAANVALNIESLGHLVYHVANASEIMKERLIAEGVSGSPQQVLRIDSNDQCAAIDAEDLTNALLNHGPFDATIISDYNKGFLPIEILAKFVPNLPRPIFVDSKKNDLSAYENCILKINESERDSAVTLPEVCELITTLGERGASWRSNTYATQKVHDVFDVCGAGDSFLAGLAIKFIETNDMINSIEFANICAGISVRHLGVHNVTMEDINKTVKA
jgi:bifunctional ADP-heptose synthase (sugar kinase/adenylyltransferase)